MYHIVFTSGRSPLAFGNMDAAKNWCRTEWPKCAIGHDGDLSDGGDRTLVWARAIDPDDNDGAKAVAKIVLAPWPPGRSLAEPAQLTDDATCPGKVWN